LRRPWRYFSRISPEPPPTALLLDTLRDILARRPAGVPAPSDELVVVEAPLRLALTAPGEGAVLVSDRALKVHWLLRPFHELQIAQSVYAELLRSFERGETTADYPWVSEGLSRVFAQRFINQARPGTRSVQDWIELFNIFAIVDRFESVPKIPFVEAFFERARVGEVAVDGRASGKEVGIGELARHRLGCGQRVQITRVSASGRCHCFFRHPHRVTSIPHV
jgi:hypothetical protein